MNTATFNQIVTAAQNADLMTLVEFAEMMEEVGYDKAAAAKSILYTAFSDGINTKAYEQIKNLYNAHLKAAA